MTGRLFDPLLYLTTSGAEVVRKGDALELAFDASVRPAVRAKLASAVERYRDLILLQLDVGPGERPRTVRQLIAGGKVVLVNGRYRAAR